MAGLDLTEKDNCEERRGKRGGGGMGGRGGQGRRGGGKERKGMGRGENGSSLPGTSSPEQQSAFGGLPPFSCVPGPRAPCLASCLQQGLHATHGGRQLTLA